MAKPVLVLMAAGLGSRYGGLKQIDPMDSHGHLLMDFSVYDAVKAGFEDVIFIIKQELQQDFEDVIGRRLRPFINVEYAYQSMDMLPGGIALPPERTKPLGTTHAILCAEAAIAGRPFLAINADDCYGAAMFREMYSFLSADGPHTEQFIVSYLIENTLSDSGPVSRGICRIQNGYLADIVERKRITRHGSGGQCTDQFGTTLLIPAGTHVSMNCWGFRPGIMPLLRRQFEENISAALQSAPLTFEDILPTAVQSLMAKGLITVRAVTSADRWFGVTYREDRPSVMAEIAALKAEGRYPEKLWE